MKYAGYRNFLNSMIMSTVNPNKLNTALKRARISYQLPRHNRPVTTTHSTTQHDTSGHTIKTTTNAPQQYTTDMTTRRQRILDNTDHLNHGSDKIYTIVMDGKLADLGDDMSMFGERPGENHARKCIYTSLISISYLFHTIYTHACAQYGCPA